MKSFVRMFALLVAIAGLASASFAPATSRTQAQPKHVSIIASDPLAVPGPEPCEGYTCVAQTASNR